MDLTARQNTAPIMGSVADFIALLKPRVMSLVVFTSLVGMLLAPGPWPHPFLMAVAVLCIAVGAGASGAFNMWYDRDIDALMRRTASRPIPDGRVDPDEAFAFASVLSVFSVIVMGLATNWVAAGLLAFTIFFYAVVYTVWLKRSTPQNIVIGGAAGAFPPMIGWAAVTGDVSWASASLFWLIFIWTPPHFWALSLLTKEEYARAKIPMLPVIVGEESTKRHIIVYSYLMVVSSFWPCFVGLGGLLYFILMAGLGAHFLKLAHRLKAASGQVSREQAKKLFIFSIAYLFIAFCALLVEQEVRKYIPSMTWTQLQTVFFKGQP